MPQKKILAKGTIIKIDGTAYGRIESATPPAREYSQVEAPELNPQDDTGALLPLDPVVFGDEIPTEFAFTCYYEPTNADASSLETKFTNKTTVAVAIETPTTPAQVISFSGKIKRLAPQQITKLGFFKRDIVIVRSTAITIA